MSIIYLFKGMRVARKAPIKEKGTSSDEVKLYVNLVAAEVRTRSELSGHLLVSFEVHSMFGGVEKSACSSAVVGGISLESLLLQFCFVQEKIS